jgi:hypothetical protein
MGDRLELACVTGEPIAATSPVTPSFDREFHLGSQWFDNEGVENRLLPKLPLILIVLSVAYAQDPFQGLKENFVPDGDAIKQANLVAVDACRDLCAVSVQCKAFAFDKAERSCYLYTRVRPGGDPDLGILSAGLAIVRKEGYVSAFKRTSFPPCLPGYSFRLRS